MNEDKEVIAAQQKTRLGESQAIAEYGNNKNMEAIIPDPGQKASTAPVRQSHAQVSTFVEMNTQSIKLEPNVWNQIHYADYFDGTTAVNILSPMNLPMDIIAGISPNRQLNGTPYPATQGTLELPMYAMNRLKSVTVQWKDFMFMVERTASGGIQFKDEPVLEVSHQPSYMPLLTGTVGGQENPIIRTRPYTESMFLIEAFGEPTEKEYYVTGLAPGFVAEGDSNYYTTTGSQGIMRTFHIDQGMGYAQELLRYRVAPPTLKWARSYKTLGQFITEDTIQDWDVTPVGGLRMLPGELFNPRRTRINFANEVTFIRCRNIPLGLTNVDVNLKFTIVVTAEWDAAYKSPVPGMTYLPLSTYAQPAFYKNLFKRSKQAKKRKLDVVEN